MRVEEIVVGERRREDLGDLDGLATSIRTYGLLHPIVVDADDRLVAGERRLRACELLGWIEIPVKRLGTLTDAELHEIELEENLRRKDLTAYERDRDLVRKAHQIAPAISARRAEMAPQGRKSVYEAPREDIAQALGASDAGLRKAEQHVAAVDRYPEVAALPASAEKRIKMAASLDALPDAERDAARQSLRNRDSAAVDTMSDLLGRPRVDYERTGRFQDQLADQSRWSRALTSVSVLLAEVKEAGGIAPLISTWPPTARGSYADQLAEAIATLTGWHAAITKEE